MGTPILEAKNIYKSYGNNSVLSDTSIDIEKGEFVAIMGPSGSGKTTLLYCLSGMDTVDSGTVNYLGKDITKMNESGKTSLRAKDFGFVFQTGHLVSNLTLFENIFVSGLVSSKGSDAEIRRNTALLMEKMNVNDASDRFPAQTSGGEAQRASIARAVIKEPGILFADEPTGALNKANTNEVLDIFTNTNNEGQTILIVTHDRSVAWRADRILYLEDGRIISSLKLAKYSGNDRDRTKKLDSWLEEMRW